MKGAFTAINNGVITGDIVIKIIDNTTETATAVLNASVTVSASYTSIIIYPTVTGKSISGTLDAALIDLSGADNVTIDGRPNATGSAQDPTITNTSVTTSAVTIRFIDGATGNTVK